jgi:DegV family protein with EDD domain
MRVAIVTDSTCDLPQDIVERLNITVVPMFIHFGDESYLDGVTITRESFYQQLVTSDVLPVTATPGSDAFLKVYRDLTEQGATHIISIHISGTLSAVMNVATIAAQSAPVPVTVVDSGNLTLGTGFLAETAAHAAADGKGVEDILEMLDDQKSRTHVFAVLETLHYLRRSGRVNPLVATFGTLLRIKPLMKMHNGVSSAEKVRTSRMAVRRLIELFMEQVPLERAALVHTHAADEAEQLMLRVKRLLPAGPILSVDITPVFGVHLGPGAVGFVCITGK